MAGSAVASRLAPTRRARYKDTWRLVKKYWFCYAMIAGTFALLITFSYYPAISAIYHSFTYWDGFRPETWAGLANYKEMFASEVIIGKSFVNMLILVTWQVFRAIVFPLIGAALVYRLTSERTAYAFRLVYVLPIVVPATVGIIVWRQLYEPNVGLFNELLKGVGLRPIAWLNSPKTALQSLMFIGFPWIDGVGMLIYLAGLLAIPNEVIEAAIMDGASSIKRFFAIEFPLIIPQFRLILILNIIGGLQNFGWQLLVTRGGPNNATTVPAWEMYQSAIHGGRFGFASAIGVVLFIIILILTLFNNSAVRSSVEYEASQGAP
jgi:raffinose/stachyose/melibiose transport system permease protein